MCNGLFRHFLFWKIVMDGHSAAMPLLVQKNIRVCALGFLIIFYFEKTVSDEHWAATPFWVKQKLRVCPIGFFVIFYFRKSSWTCIRPLCHFWFRKIFEYAH